MSGRRLNVVAVFGPDGSRWVFTFDGSERSLDSLALVLGDYVRAPDLVFGSREAGQVILAAERLVQEPRD
ncbi:MAG: hypothetical protein ACF8TS_05825 [Maioricimonas sp. JB049]